MNKKTMKLNQTAEEIQDDLQRLDYGDPEISAKYEELRRSFKTKGLPYRELFKSKFLGTLKYLLVELHDEHGTVLITDMDNNATYSFCDKTQKKTTESRIRDWAMAK